METTESNPSDRWNSRITWGVNLETVSVSVIIPAYNASAFLAETLESALRQTLPADDILVVDDGSTDDTAAIAANFPPPVRVISIPNSKLGAARNFGVNRVNTEWVAFLDADDIWKEDKLELQMEALRRYPKADICYTGHCPFSMNGDERVVWPRAMHCPVEQVRKQMFQKPPFQPSSVIMRRSTLLAVGGFCEDPAITEDWDLWWRLLDAGVEFAACPEPLLLYRIHGSSITANTLNMAAMDVRVYQKHVLPRLSGPAKWMAHSRVHSKHKAEIAYSLRNKSGPGSLRTMTASILQWPFGDPVRYKVWLHMLLTKLKLIPAKH